MRFQISLLAIALNFVLHLPSQAQLTIPSDGSDGALNISADTVIDLSQAVDGSWDDDNSANAGKGIYDKDKWAIVFKYSSVNIDGVYTDGDLSGAKVTFINHPSRAPVVWLVQGDVTINGIVDIRGKDGTSDAVERLRPVEGGPGGFRGAATGPSGRGWGLGPGGGGISIHGSHGGGYLGSYGNPQILPLIGGSGGAASSSWSGAGGGGAILIAASGGVAVAGKVDAGGSAGGAIKIVSHQVTGAGELSVIGNAGAGRIRLETNLLATSLRTFPETIGVPPADPPVLWLPDNAPSVRILSVDGVASPEDPRAPLVSAADIAIENDAPVDILIETKNFPVEGVVQLRWAYKYGWAGWLTATLEGGDATQATWKVTTAFIPGFTTLQARITAP